MLKQLLYKIILLFVLLALPFWGCDETNQSPIPDFPIFLELRLSSQYPTFKNSTGQFLHTEKDIILTTNDRIGFGGVVICSGITLDDYGKTQYYAFDMACPYEAKRETKVYPDTTGLPYLVCQKCGSVFDVGFGNGNPLSGPATAYLKKYRTAISGEILYVNR